MRHIRIVVVIVGAMCALAICAGPAMAQPMFHADKTGKSTGRGYEEIQAPEVEAEFMQEFKFGSFRILCYRAHETGEVTALESDLFTTTIKFLKCGWYPESSNTLHVAATFSKGGMTVVYHALGWVEALGNGEGEEEEYKKAEVLETSAYFKISSTKLCKIVIPAQTIPVTAKVHPENPASSAVYSEELQPAKGKNFPLGEQRRLVIANEFKKILYKYGYAGEETQCQDAPEFEKTAEEGGGATAGVYKGVLEEWVPGGNLWEE